MGLYDGCYQNSCSIAGVFLDQLRVMWLCLL